MALDGVFLGEIKKELIPLIGGRVDKIHQPSKGELLIALRTYDGLKKLLINTVAGTARLHLTAADIENQYQNTDQAHQHTADFLQCDRFFQHYGGHKHRHDGGAGGGYAQVDGGRQGDGF